MSLALLMLNDELIELVTVAREDRRRRPRVGVRWVLSRGFYRVEVQADDDVVASGAARSLERAARNAFTPFKSWVDEARLEHDLALTLRDARRSGGIR